MRMFAYILAGIFALLAIPPAIAGDWFTFSVLLAVAGAWVWNGIESNYNPKD